MIPIIILGSTGSIGTQACDVLRDHPGIYQVRGLAAGGGNLELLVDQAAEFNVPYLAVANQSKVDELAELIATRGLTTEIVTGEDPVTVLAGMAGDGIVLNGVTGSIGLAPTLAALSSGAQLALANKESIVAGGSLVAEAMVRPGQIVPVDSEHSAIAQALRGGKHGRGLTVSDLTGDSEVARIILTASGGPFRGKTRADLADVTAEQALKHPTWAMGPVVTVNSSTLMNKGLELIEASVLFDVPPEQITPVIHPQSVVHSMVEFIDGSTLAQASPPSMMLPIALGFSWPDRLENVVRPCAWEEATAWTFEPVDHDTFPALTLAKESLAAGPLHPAVLNASNEVCVDAFLAGELGYLAMADVVAQTLEAFDPPAEISLESTLGAEQWARDYARRLTR